MFADGIGEGVFVLCLIKWLTQESSKWRPSAYYTLAIFDIKSHSEFENHFSVSCQVHLFMLTVRAVPSVFKLFFHAEVIVFAGRSLSLSLSLALLLDRVDS